MRQIAQGALCALAWTVCLSAIGQEAPPAGADDDDAAVSAYSITAHSSPHFRLYTDLDADAAGRAIQRMEKTLKWASQQWRRRLRGKITCYLAADIDRWPASKLPHPHARIWIKYVDGATVDERTTDGDKTRHQATIYASTRHGVLEHEVIHAFCAQAFGFMGPDWYKEGMAVLASHLANAEQPHRFAPELLATLHTVPHRSVRQIVDAEPTTRETYDWLEEKFARVANQRRGAAETWTDGDARDLAKLHQEYHWSWSLCHLLLNNPNYQRRFRALGDCYLAGHEGAFDDLFGAFRREISFEHRFLLDHLEDGYRVDLSRWDWRVPEGIAPGGELKCRVDAARGYQSTRVKILPNVAYEYSTTGTWATSPDGPTTDAGGQPQGAGRLVAVLQRDYQLLEPFELGASGSFVSPVSGHLYVRCHDRWNELSDNRGHIRLVIRRP